MNTTPPRLARWLLTHLLPSDERDEVIGDLHERFVQEIGRGASRTRVTLWYWGQVTVVPGWLWTQRIKHWRINVRDLRMVVRHLARSPGFTIVALLSLTLGIGATTTMFSTMRSVLYTTLPVHEPNDLYFVYHTRPDNLSIRQYNSSQDTDAATGQSVHSSVTFDAFERFRANTLDPARLLGFTFARRLSILAADQPAFSANGLMVSGDFFRTLQLDVARGRALSSDDLRSDAPAVAVISHAFWQRAFGGSDDAVGQIAVVNDHPFEIVGVTPAAFAGLSPGGFFPPTDITIPFTHQPILEPGWAPPGGSLFISPDRAWLRAVVRIPAGTDLDRLQTALSASLRQSMVDAGIITPDQAREVSAVFLSAARGLDSLRRTTTQPIRILMVVVGVVLLITCANLSTLLLARGATRSQEMAIRTALGASRGQLVNTLFLEVLVLGVLGGLGGLAVTWWSRPFVATALTAGLGPVSIELHADWLLYGLALAVSLGAAVFSGILPALRISNADPMKYMTTRTEGGSGSRVPFGRGLIIAQISISMPLIVAAGLFLRTIANLTSIDPGFRSQGLVTFSVDPTSIVRDTAQANAFYPQLLQRLETLPGIRAASLIENPFMAGWVSNTRVEIDGESVPIYTNAIGPRFFETFGIEVVAGRTPTVEGSSPISVVINETAAQRYFGGNAVGRSMRTNTALLEIVGVAEDTKYARLRDDVPPMFFHSYRLGGRIRAMNIVLSAADTDGLETRVRDIVAQVDQRIPMTGFRTQNALMDTAVARERVFTQLLVVFGAFALFLASIGLHGVTTFSIARRSREMGVRLALGANPGSLLSMVIKQVLVLAVVGQIIGLSVAYATTPLIGSMLYGLQPQDPTTLVWATTIMTTVAIVAAWFPARRAARTDPLVSLRS